jgi:hypothetical protein
MSIYTYLRSEYVEGRVAEKYRRENGGLAVVVEEARTGRRYCVEFKDDGRQDRNSLSNLYGLLRDPYAGKIESLDKLVRAGDRIGVSTTFNRGPFREGYRIHYVSNRDEQGNLSGVQGYLSQPGRGVYGAINGRRY